MKKKVQTGFTLIELMLVLGIIGFLALIAIPTYQDYLSKSQAAAALSEISSTRAPIEVALSEVAPTQDVYAATQAELRPYGLTDAHSSRCTYLVTINHTDEKAAVQCLMKGSGAVGGKHIQLWRAAVTDSLTGVWVCKTNVDKKFAPAGCDADPSYAAL